jgi:hypothetical protein
MKDETKKLLADLAIPIFILVAVILVGWGVMTYSVETTYKTGFEIKEYTGIVYDVQITSYYTIVVFDNGFYLTFSKPPDTLVDHYPFLDTIQHAYSYFILLKGETVTIKYVHSFDGFNYCD